MVVLNYMENEKTRLNQVVLWKLIPNKIMESNAAIDEKHETLRIFHRLKVSDAPLELIFSPCSFF